jgi:hypothetical protein
MLTLTVHREWQNSYCQTTILRDNKGKVKGIIPSSIKQPRRGQKTIVLNCFTWLLNWDNVAGKQNKKQKENEIH